MITLQDGKFCPDGQPEWSAYRDPSFGHGEYASVPPPQAVAGWLAAWAMLLLPVRGATEPKSPKAAWLCRVLQAC